MNDVFYQGIFKITVRPLSICILDLTNAGKRGKKCPEWTIDVWSRDYQLVCDVQYNMDIKLRDVNTLEDLDAFLLCVSAKGAKYFLHSYPSFEVAPRDAEPVSFANSRMSLVVSYNGFTASDLTDMHNMPMIINSSRSSTSANVKFWKLCQKTTFTEDMDIYDVGELARSCGVRTHSYCALD
jgi:hypothetical protein